MKEKPFQLDLKSHNKHMNPPKKSELAKPANPQKSLHALVYGLLPLEKTCNLGVYAFFPFRKDTPEVSNPLPLNPMNN